MVADVVLELTSVVRLAKADFADGKPKMISDIRGRLCSRGRTRVHQDAHKLNRNRITTEASGYIATGAVAYQSPGKHRQSSFLSICKCIGSFPVQYSTRTCLA